MKVLFPLLLVFALASCSPQKRLAKLIEKHPELVKTDTVFATTDTIIPEVRVDTLFKWQTDTVTITNDRLEVTLITDTITKTIRVQGKCKTDTVTITHPVYIQKVEPVKIQIERRPYWYQWIQIYIGKFALIGGVLLFLYGYFMRRRGA